MIMIGSHTRIHVVPVTCVKCAKIEYRRPMQVRKRCVCQDCKYQRILATVRRYKRKKEGYKTARVLP